MLERVVDILLCPACLNGLEIKEDSANCRTCKRVFPVIDGVIVLLSEESLRSFLETDLGKELQSQNYGSFLSSSWSYPELQGVARYNRLSIQIEEANSESQGSDFNAELAIAVEKSTRLLAEFVQAERAESLLDLATGPGSFLRSLHKIIREGTFIVATDVNAGLLFSTKRKIEPLFHLCMGFVVCDVRDMPFRESSFQAVTALGGTCEFADADVVIKKSHKVLRKGGWLGLSGDQYKEGSESFQIAKRLGVSSVVTRQRLEACLIQNGFTNIVFATVYEGYEAGSEEGVEDRCPLPVPGDWFSHVVVAGQKE